MCTIPPRQQLPITRRLAIRIWRIAHVLIIIIIRIKLVTSERERNARQKLFTLSIKILQYLFLHKFVAQEEDSFITSRTEERDKERERKSKSLVLVSLLTFRVLSSCFLLPLLLGERSEYSGKINWIFVR